MIFTFPPISVFSSRHFDPVLTHREQAEHMHGLADTFEPNDPAMHRTKSVDYAVVLEGEIWLELDDGVTTACNLVMLLFRERPVTRGETRAHCRQNCYLSLSEPPIRAIKGWLRSRVRRCGLILRRMAANLRQERTAAADNLLG